MAEMNELKDQTAGANENAASNSSRAIAADAPEDSNGGSRGGIVQGDRNAVADDAEVVSESAASSSTATDASESAPSLNVAGARPEIVSEGGEGGEELKLYLGEFAGPLDLLLYLIRQEQVDIYDIPIARITDEYLRYLRLMQDMDIAVASEFLVMAAQLIEIKSKMLLPPDPVADAAQAEAEDPRSELIKQLLEHQKFKAAAQMLWSRSTVEQAVYVRAPIETDKANPEVSAGVFDLLKVFQEILARKKQEVLMEIERDEVTMAEMLERLRNMILSAGELNLRLFFERAQTRRELVLAFLSVLEIVRASEVVLVQKTTFGDIVARVNS
ncbi:MAG TPA: segregation/condensation protein A [Pyrinomonadaceae bacterium]|jgi:segregation and condensation protein A|nr:segregation/condensation protein A [Pyrinomonadaceae bacterium]